jgi:hypothetical protein
VRANQVRARLLAREAMRVARGLEAQEAQGQAVSGAVAIFVAPEPQLYGPAAE